MYVSCDLAMQIILSKSNNHGPRDFSLDARLPSMYFQAQPECFQDVQNYTSEAYLQQHSSTTNAPQACGYRYTGEDCLLPF